MEIEENIPLLEEILADWRECIGAEYRGYRNHIYRMLHFCMALRDCGAVERQKLVIAGAFHDIGIWVDDTVDYIPPSISPAMQYLRHNGLEDWCDEVRLMISEHHKLRRYRGEYAPMVELFRRGDLVDFSCGLVRFGLDRGQVEEVRSAFPNAGFHRNLGKRALHWLPRHPFRPLPMMKW
ncbi:hypothetical protein [Microbulbifer sediminum]|uniref:hypothetical protein n=1 Tax=Microbulbifer sediminum TaxID=2904250 RepID=UPI001F3BA0B2|nr:hypothetical protein [Microbulbifer sediminum]